MVRLKKLACSVLLLVSSQAAVAELSIYRTVEANHGIPDLLLYAIALTESGTTLNDGQYIPWPWTLNVAGSPRYFSSRESAWRHLEYVLSQGEELVDIGAGQVNWYWHSDKFASTWDALDPAKNIYVAGVILNDCHRQRGDWINAVGCYHSPGNQKRAIDYTRRVYERWSNL